MSKIFLSFIILFSIQSFGNSLNCASYEDAKFRDYDNNSYLFEVGKGQRNDEQLRKAVTTFNQLKNANEYTIEELDALGEGVYFSQYQDKFGNLYDGVNVGFGGGNSADYFFHKGTLEFAPIFLEDGDCYNQGENASFPMDIYIEEDQIEYKVMTCQLEGQSPLKKIEYRYQTYKGKLINPMALVTGTIVLNDETRKISTSSEYIQVMFWDYSETETLSIKGAIGSTEILGIEIRNKGDNYWTGNVVKYEVKASCSKLPDFKVEYTNNVKNELDINELL